jgi:hypothetical protein
VWDAVEGQYGHEAERNPGCLGRESYEEFGQGFLDLVEAGVFAI